MAAGVALAAIAGVYFLKKPTKAPETIKTIAQEVKKEAPEITTKIENFAAKFESKNPQMLKHIKDTRTRNMGEYKTILRENTYDGMINLDNMDKAAEFRALDVKRDNYLHEAANFVEESYKEAYQKAKPEEGKNILDMIYNRIDKESKTIPNIYAQMPIEEALERINIFTKSAYDINPKPGMSPAVLFDKIVEFMEKAKL